ncbi:MAG: beta-propeller fold lactonase family protein [Chloroflexota bacterium]
MNPQRIVRYPPWLLVLLLLSVGLGIPESRAQQDAPLYALPGTRAAVFTSSTMDLSNNGRTLVLANMLNDTLSIVDVAARVLITEIPVGQEPRGVALTPDDQQAVVVNRADGTISVVSLADSAETAVYPVGVLPFSVVSGDNTSAFVSLQGQGEVVQVDLATGEVLTRIATPSDPAGLALWGDFLYVTHLWSGELSLIYLPNAEVVRTIQSDPLASLTPSVTINQANGLAYLPQSLSNTRTTALTFDSAVTPALTVVDLADMRVTSGERIALSIADRPVNMPYAVAVDPVRNWAYVVNAGTNDVSVIELSSGEALANVVTGANPRGAVLSFDNAFLYVHNAIEGSLTIIETRTQTVDDVLSISDLRVPVDQLIGAELFHSARDERVGARWLSCASCHFDGQSDGRVWQDLAEGPRNTPLLFDLAETAPYNWTGSWDELADVELKIRDLQVGTGLIEGRTNAPLGDPHAGLSLDLDILVSYLLSIQGPPTPPQPDREMALRGEELFQSLDCASCHTGATFSDGLVHDVGTGGAFNTPTLNWLWQSAPYLHDGRATTLRDVFILPGAHQLVTTLDPAQIDALVAYLLTLPQ